MRAAPDRATTTSIKSWSRYYLRILLVSAVLLFVGTATALVLAYVTSRRSIERGFHQEGRALLEGMVRNARRQLEIVEDLQNQAPLDRDIRRYLVSKAVGSPQAPFLLEDAVAGLRARMLPVRLLENVAVYLVEEELLITALGAEQPRYFFDRYVYEVGSSTEIAALVRDERRPALHTRRLTYQDAFPLVALIRNMRLDQRRVTVIAHLKPQQLLPDQAPGNGAFVIWGPGGERLASSGVPIEPAAIHVESTPAYGVRFVSTGGSYYLFTEVDGPTGWCFAYAAPARDLEARLRRLSLWTALIGVGMAAAAGLVAYLVAGTVYRPVDAVLRRILPSPRTGGGGELRRGPVDEFEAIGRQFSRLQAQNVGLSDILSRARPLLREGVVRDVLTGRQPFADVEARLAEAEISFDRSTFTIVILHVGEACAAPPGYGQEVHSLIRRGVAAISRARLEGWRSEIAEMDGDTVVLLINHDDTPAEGLRLRELVRGIQDDVHRQMQTAVTAVMSKPCSSVAEVHHRYREAARTLESRHLRNPGMLLSVEETVAEGEETSFYYPVEKERLIINAAVSGDCAHAGTALVQLLEDNLCGRPLRADVRDHLLSAVAGTIVRICYRLQLEPGEILPARADIYQTLRAFQSWEEMKQGVEGICAAIAGKISHDRRESEDRLRRRFKSYIVENHGRTFSLQEMADAFGLTPSYLSELFKERMGENFIDYLTTYRMDVAKELLTTSSLKVVDIALRSGYANVTSFIRVFKKHEGVSPGAYREMQRRSDS